MKVIRISKTEWQGGLDKARTGYGLYGPVKEGQDDHAFRPLAPGEFPDMSYKNSKMSPKELVHPQSEPMFRYNLNPADPDHDRLQEVPKDASPKAIIGIRPCDADAFLLVKRNFDTPVYRDPYWVTAFESFTKIGLACNQACSATAFCTSAGSGPFHDAGLDVLLVDTGEGYLAKVVTEKGQHFLDACGFSAPAADATAQIESLQKTAEATIASSVNTDKLKDQVTTELYDAPFWEDVSFACINCGTCTFSCPTCWCFDIQDETRGKQGVRMRNWDSCMYPLFTLHGSGHNPRGTKVHRVRQRFMHKLKYYVDKYQDGIQCVGCGRCIRLCPVNIDIRKVCNMMNGYTACSCAVS